MPVAKKIVFENWVTRAKTRKNTIVIAEDLKYKVGDFINYMRDKKYECVFWNYRHTKFKVGESAEITVVDILCKSPDEYDLIIYQKDPEMEPLPILHDGIRLVIMEDNKEYLNARGPSVS
jgi:hypothetical protein